MLIILLKAKQMQTQLMRLLFLTCALSLTACSDSDDTKTEPTDPEARSTINGIITFANNLATDSDLNDRNSPYEDNSKFTLAQSIENITTVQGFVTKSAIQDLVESDANNSQSKLKNSRFYTSADEFDYFKTELIEGQIIQLQTVSSMYSNPVASLSGDLDLFLFDDNYNIVKYSTKLSEIDTITVPDSGSYFIAVQANKGASKYVLKLSSGVSNQNFSQKTQNSPSKPSLDFVPNELIVTFSDQSSIASHTSSSSNMRTTHAGKERPTLARFSDTRASASSRTKHNNNTELASLNYKSYEKFMTIQKLKSLQEQPDVTSASLNYRRYPLQIPSDTLYNKQWHYPAMKLPEAWDLTTGTPESGDVIVAVIDTGIYSSHPDLLIKLVDGYDFISDPENASDNDSGDSDPNSDIDDNPEDIPGESSSPWHGTHVAGTIAAKTNNNYGVAGVSWGAKIMPLRALGKYNGTTYDIMQAIRFAAGLPNDSGTLPAKPADIINLSLGSYEYIQAEEMLYSQVRDLGIIVVAAAGNDTSSAYHYPASYPSVISVSAIDFNSEPTAYSNYGSKIDIAAPGGDTFVDSNQDGEVDGVLSTYVTDNNGLPNADFEFLDGTSMASPHVAGMFALMKAVYPDLNASSALRLLKAGKLTDDLGLPGRDDSYGYGSANALKAVQEAIALKNGANLPTISFDMKASRPFISLTGSNVSEVLITNEGDTKAQVQGVVTSSDWLSVRRIDSDDKDDSNLGRYSIIADASELEFGYYQGIVSFDFSSNVTNEAIPMLNVYVSMNLSESGHTSNTAKMGVKLYQQGTFDLVKQITTTENTDAIDGSLMFTLDKLKAGSYDLYASTDIDNDDEVCVNGEVCAKYRSLTNPEPIEISVDSTTDIVINADILHSLN